MVPGAHAGFIARPLGTAGVAGQALVPVVAGSPGGRSQGSHGYQRRAGAHAERQGGHLRGKAESQPTEGAQALLTRGLDHGAAGMTLLRHPRTTITSQRRFGGEAVDNLQAKDQ